jgi:acid phosphatase type 7
MKYVLLLGALVILTIVVVQLIQHPTPSNKPPRDFETLRQAEDQLELNTSPVIVAAGDIACNSLDETPGECNQELTAKLIEAINPEAVLVLGDIQYQTGTYENFTNFFDKSWGRFKDKIKPTVGNHEYSDPEAAGYFKYFGEAAGGNDKGYYSFDIGSWHLVSLNSNCWAIGGCDMESPQYKWLIEDLEKNTKQCVIAYWHHPRFSSGLHGNYDPMDALFRALYDHKVELLLSGHDHTYERLAKINPEGEKDDQGIRSFIVGTGGRNLYRFLNPLSFSESKQNQEFGVLKLTLNDNSYDWEFVSIKDQGFTDSGSDTCL